MGEQVAARIKEKREQKLFKIGNRKKEEKRRGLSSAGRAPALQAGGREFESLSLHLQYHPIRENCRRYLENRILKIQKQ